MTLSESITSVPLIRLSAINPFPQELVSRNLDARPLLEDQGLPPQIPASGELFVSALSIYRLVEEIARFAGDPFFGARLGSKLDLTTWEPTADAVKSATTVSDLLNRFIVNLKHHASSVRFAIETVGNRSTFSSMRVVGPPFVPAQNDAFYLGFMSKLVRSATGDRWHPDKVFAPL